MNANCDKCKDEDGYGYRMSIIKTEVQVLDPSSIGRRYVQTQRCSSCGRTIRFSIPCIVLEEGER